MKHIPGWGDHRKNVVVSLCDYSGNWPKYYAEAGYTVLQYDLKHGDDITKLPPSRIGWDIWNALNPRSLGRNIRIAGVLMAPPCTHFTVSCNRLWAEKDADGRTAEGLAVLDACLEVQHVLKPAWWALENPVGRLGTLRPGIGKPYYFNPHDFAQWAPDPEKDRYTKKTGLWGHFTAPVKAGLTPINVCNQGSWVMKLGGKSERTKELRSITPLGFSRAFYRSNP